MKSLLQAALLALSIGVCAQDSLKTVRLEEIAITAVRASEQAPVPKTNVSRKQIEEKYNGQHPIFLLEKLTPGFYSFSESGTSYANYGQFRLRGINQERINITLNGVPLNDMIDQGVFFSNFTDITSNFESIQVQRGVGTSTNGVSSYGGSINFESINLQNKEAYSEAQLGAGSFNTYRANFQHFTGISEKGWGFLSSFSRLTSDGFRDNTSTDATSFFLTGGYYGEKDLLKLTLFTARSENGLGYYTIDRSILETNPTFNNLTSNDTDDFSQHMVQLQYNRYLNDNLTLGVTGYYGGAGGDFQEGTPDVDSVFVENYFTNYRTNFFSINFPLSNDHWGGIANLDYQKGSFSFNTGLHIYTFLRDNRQEILPNRAEPFYFEESSKSEVSWFGKANYNLGKLNLYADVQVRTANLTISPDYEWIGINPEGDVSFDWTFVNPKIGLTYDASEDLSIYGSFGRSGREPTKIDIFGGFQLGPDNYPSIRDGLDFQDEFVNDLELGVRVNKNNLVIDANYYNMSFENEIAPIGAQIAFGVLQRENIESSRRSGFELQWVYTPAEIIEWNGTAAYLNTNVDAVTLDGTEFSNREHILSPAWIINSQVKVKPNDQFQLGLSGRYLAEQFMELSNDPNFTVPSSFVMDLSADVHLTDAIKVSGIINNLFDNQYYTFGAVSDVDGSGTLEPGFFAQPERNFFLSVVVKF